MAQFSAVFHYHIIELSNYHIINCLHGVKNIHLTRFLSFITFGAT